MRAPRSLSLTAAFFAAAYLVSANAQLNTSCFNEAQRETFQASAEKILMMFRVDRNSLPPRVAELSAQHELAREQSKKVQNCLRNDFSCEAEANEYNLTAARARSLASQLADDQTMARNQLNLLRSTLPDCR